MELLFTGTAVVFNLLIAGIFIAERLGKRQTVRKLGTVVVSLLIPFSIVFIDLLIHPKEKVVPFGLLFVLIYLVVELLLDFVLKFDFRSKWITHVPYILLEYAAFFGLINTASAISKTAIWVVSITFWIAMAGLVFLYAGSRKRKENLN